MAEATRHVLVVDDEDALREAVVRDLKKRGFQTHSASDTEAAYEIILRQPIIAVISDMQMPGATGIDLLRRVKASHPKIAFILCLTDVEFTNLIEAFDLGAEAVFPKPFDRKTLYNALEQATQPLDSRWGNQRLDRLPLGHREMSIQLKDLGVKQTGAGVNIGRGGMFISLAKEIPHVGMEVSFNIVLAESPYFSSFNGSGIVRWVRTKQGEGLPTGCGVEFTFVEEPSRRQLIQFLNDSKTLAFIPKK